jgi:glycosyltransferase involved in cell wall biosynthesis
MELRIVRSADLVTTVSRALAEELAKRYGVDLDQTNVLGNAVDTSLFVPDSEKREGRYVLYTGRLAWNKGLVDLIKCAKHVLKACPDVSFTLTGKGPAERHVKRLVARMGMDREFSFVGFVDKRSLIRLYQNSSVFVCPSYYEGLPTTLLEAMACGLPVVATGVGGISEVIEDGQNGFLVPTRSPEALADRIVDLLNTSGLRAQMGRSARKTVEECYSWDKTVARALGFYESIM